MQDPFRAVRRRREAAPVPATPPEPRTAPVPAPEPPAPAEAPEPQTMPEPEVEQPDITWPVARLVRWAGKDAKRARWVLEAEALRSATVGEPRRETLWLRLDRVARGG